MSRIKTLIVDDSVVYRTQIKAALAMVPQVEVLASASNGKLAIERLQQGSYDLLILDMEMPEMDGLQTLTEMSRLGLSAKTLVFSSITKRGAEITLEALRIGAQDFITKPGQAKQIPESAPGSTPADTIRALLEPKIQALFPTHFSDFAIATSTVPGPIETKKTYPTILWELFNPKIILIGSSTGGPSALEKILQQIHGPIEVPVLIAQHMPPVFTANFAERISRLSGIPCKEGSHGEVLQANTIYIAPGGYHMTLEGSAINPRLKLDQGPMINSVRPAVDPLFQTAANMYRDKCLAIILTGMGQDGKVGCQAIKDCGGAVVIQDADSSVVYGMPGAVKEAGSYDKILTPDEIASLLSQKITSTHKTLHNAERNSA
jgi:two-component system, chemotaxis family, protein-glutamate methylesterase/glutaminase